MKKIEINNEIVRMRHIVRQARVCVINKLVREAKTLRTKNGTEKQKERNKRKADKLINEIYALKKIKDDRITKFAITNTKTLKEIMESKNARDSTRIIARVADYKTLKSAIVQFQETYPEYEKYLQPKKVRSAKPKNRSTRKNHNERSGIQTRSTNRNAPSTSASGNFMQDGSNLSDDSESSNGEGNVNQSDLEIGSILRIKTASCAQTKQKENKYSNKNKSNSASLEEETMKCMDETTGENTKNVKRLKTTGAFIENGKQESIKIVSKEAAVKRFTELLQEENKDESIEMQHKLPTKYESKLQKKVDEFFMSGDGNVYLSMAAAIIDDTENNVSRDEDTAPPKKSEEFPIKTSFRNDKFFSNVKNHDARYERPKREKYEYKQDNLNRTKDQAPFDVIGKHKFKPNDVRRTNDVENLHPSWAARKKQQEIMKTAFQGKKIVFDDV